MGATSMHQEIASHMSTAPIIVFAALLIMVCAVDLRCTQAAPAPAGSADPSHTGAPQIWFAPKDPLRIDPADRGSADYMQLFQPEAPWARAAAHVQVFELYPQFMHLASDAQLTTVFGWLKRHNIGLAVSIGMLSPLPNCRRIEGYGTGQLAMAQRIRRLGGDLRYVAADEPLWAGRGYSTAGACQSAIPDIAAAVAGSARAFQSIFPQVQFVDDEPILNRAGASWPDEIVEFHDAFRRAYGQPLSAVHLDIAWWEASWQQRVLALTTHLRRRGLRIGVIYNGNPGDRTATGFTHELAR
jgi:hypothetical protein